MKINERYEIRVVIIEMNNTTATTGDVYDNFKEFRKNHPSSPYKFGYVVFDTETGYVPDNCNDWNDSPEEAMFDYEDNCRDNPEYDFYEVEVGTAADGAGKEGYEAPYSICIKATDYPSIKDAKTFLQNDMATLGYDTVHSVTLISRSEVHSFFDDSNVDNWPIYTVPARDEETDLTKDNGTENKMISEITIGHIYKGLEKDIIQLIPDPNMDCGTVCQIGERWFYFDSQATTESPEGYLSNTPMANIVDAIHFSLEDMLMCGKDYEYWYYAGVLEDALGNQEITEKEYRFKVALCEGQYFGEYNTTGRNVGEAEDKAIVYFSDKLASILPEYDIPITVTLVD